MLMDIYNHSSYQITKRYLGIDQDDKDQVFEKIRQVKVSVIYYSVYQLLQFTLHRFTKKPPDRLSCWRFLHI